MELIGDNWKNYSTPFIDKNKDSEFWKKDHPESLKLKTSSVGDLYDKIMWMKDSCERNNENIYDVPVFIEFDNKKYTFTKSSFGFGRRGCECCISTDKDDELVFTAPDSRPEAGGEYWASRGPSSFDCAGYIKSKKAGQRIQRLVNYILEKDETKSWLDFREFEPNYIQYKFSAEEFDVIKLSGLSIENNGIITEQILRSCVKEEI